jgi:hypothetical protein
MIYSLNTRNNSEHMDNLITKELNIIDTKFLGSDKRINFTTKINDKDYFLAVIPKTKCSNLSPVNADCANNMLVLLETNLLKPKKDEYESKLSTELKKCNFDQKLKCEEFNKNDQKEVLGCDKEYSACDSYKKKNFINQFMLQKSPNKVGTYIVTGTHNTLDNISAETSLMNPLIGQHNLTYICVDDNVNSPNIFNDITIIPHATQTGGIIGAINSGDTYKLSMPRQLYSENKFLFDKNNQPQVKSMYFGVCDNDKVCRMDNNDVKRICLYNDIFDHNILEFSIVID